MAHFHEGSVSSTIRAPLNHTYLTHKCKSCGQIKGEWILNHDIEPYLCDNCKKIEQRDNKLNALLNKKWWEIWK